MMENRNRNKTIISLLASVGLANIGEWIYFIALNMMILNNGGNSLSVGLLYIIRPIGDILTNFLFSTYVDQLSKRKWMMTLSFFRAGLVGGLMFNQDLFFIYSVVFLIQVCNSIYEPLSLGYIALAIPVYKIKKFNSWNSLVSSGGFLIGPAIAGLLLSIGTPITAILVNSFALIASAAILSFLPDYNIVNDKVEKMSFIENNKRALLFLKEYYFKNQVVVLFYIMVSSLTILAAGLDSVEAAFSKEVLFMSDSQYGLLVSISGAGFLIGSIINNLIVEKMTIKQLILFGGFIYVIGYLIFSTSFNFMIASIGFFLISFALSYINTGFRTFVQIVFPKNKIGQLTTAFNILNSIMEMGIVVIVSGLGTFVPIRLVLIATELLMLIIIITIACSFNKLKFEKLDSQFSVDLGSFKRNEQI